MEPLPSPSLALPPAGGLHAAIAGVTRSPAHGLTLAELFDSEESGLLRFAMGLVRRREIAEDLVQETFLRLHPLWNEVENPRAWLYRSLRNLALNHLRDHAREAPLEDAVAVSADDLPSEQLGQMEAVGLVKMLLAEMSDEDRKLIRMKYHEDLKYRDISQRTGISVGNVGYRLHHLLKGLADALRQAGIEGSRR